MKILIIRTKRIFNTEEDWLAYKSWTPLDIDFAELEKGGQLSDSRHKPDEILDTLYTLEEIR